MKQKKYIQSLDLYVKKIRYDKTITFKNNLCSCQEKRHFKDI